MSPTARTLKYLKDKGLPCQVVEHFNHWAKVRNDLFGFIDILALDLENKQCVGIQVTTASNKSNRIKKILASPLLHAVKGCGIKVEVHAWKKISKKECALSRKHWGVSIDVI